MDTILSAGYQPYSEALDKLGFCTFHVFDTEERERLLNLYKANFETTGIKGLYATHNSNPVEQSISISRDIKKIVDSKLRDVFPGYNYFIGHFMVKAAHNEEFALHQDWNIVDESKFRSYQVWIPLELAYPGNGGMFVIPGSHKFFGNYRSGSYDIPRIPFEDKVEKLVTDIITSPGNVLVYHNALFHASRPNTTDDIRIAVIANYVERNAPLHYFHKNQQKGCTELYAIDEESFIADLPLLEKGKVDKLVLQEPIPLCQVHNEEIAADDLARQYLNKTGKVNAAQLKQLHIAVDADLENEMNEEGYAIIDLLNASEIDIFAKEYNSHFGNIDRTPGRFTTLQHADARLKKKVHDFIVKNIDVPLKKYFRDFIIPVSQFYTKKAFTSGDIDLHADSTLLLNHQLEPHYAVWIPLIDVDGTNGTLTVIPRSHRVNGALFFSSVSGYHHQHMDWLRKFEIPLTLKAGQAVVFDNNLLHSSTSNQTGIDRLCCTFRITHFASQYYSFFCEKPEEGAVLVSEEAHDYYMAEEWDGNSKAATGKYIGTYQNGLTRVQKAELEKILNPSPISA